MKFSTLVQRAMGRLNALAAGVALLALVAWPALAQAQNVTVVPSDTTLVNGDTFTVRVATDGSTDLRAYHLIYQYDHTKMQFMSASVGELAMGHSPSPFLVPDVLSAAPDSVIYDVALLGSSASGPGILAYFTFKAVSTGSTTLTPLKVDFRNSLNQQTLPATSGATVHINDVLAVNLGTGGITPVSCFGGSNGAIDITASGGVGPYTYLWSPGGATTEDLSGIAAGNYMVTVTDANNRTVTGSWSVTQPTQLVASAVQGAAILCNGGTTTVTVSASGGTAPYAGTGTFTVGAGTHNYTVTDAHGCTSMASVTVTEPTLLTASAVAGTIACHGGTTTVTVSASGGTPAYTGTGTFTAGAGTHNYPVTDANGCTTTASVTITEPTQLTASAVQGAAILCNGGTTTVTVSGSGGTPSYTGTGTFTVGAGVHNYTVTDANGCTANTSITVTEPTLLTASAVQGAAISCNGGTTTITVSASGGTPPYGGTGTFTAGVGTHNYPVTDANGCTTTASVTVSEPTTLSASAVAGTIACNGGTTTVTVSATGGTPPYSGTGTFTVGAGLHSYTVTDASGCSASASVTLTEPAVLAASETHTSTCLTSPDGSITLTVSGGTSPYNYLWSNGAISQNLTGLAAGSYSVTVTDAHGCTTNVGPVAIVVRTYTITPSAGAGGSISPSTIQTLNCGANQSFTITPAACYTFTGLLVDGASVTPVSPYTFTDLHADHTIAASFTPIALPLPVTSITATRTTSGNDGSGVTKITINYTPPGDGNTVEIWRKGFGNYPEYDDGPGAGSVPGMPASYPPAGWTKTLITASGQTDLPLARDYWYYVAYTVNACGQTTVSSVKTGGTLDYFLGDVHNGIANCAGDNQVTLADITFLGNNYGTHLSDPDALGCLDVGPTSTGWVDGRPLTDNQVEFEDLIMFAINYGTVSEPSMRVGGTGGSAMLSLSVPATPAVGETFEALLNFKGNGGVQGLSAQLEYDASVVEPVAVASGSLLGQQAGPAQAFSPKPGTVDAAVFGNGLSLTGAGELARVRFRVKSAGDPAIAMGNVRARDSRNQPVALMTPPPVDSQPMPTRLELAPSYPNPFNNSLTVVFGMPLAGPVKLAVFDIQGRTVRHLIDGTVKAGWTRTAWNGRSDEGMALAPGMYVIRLSADGRVTTKSVRLVR